MEGGLGRRGNGMGKMGRDGLRRSGYWLREKWRKRGTVLLAHF